VEKKRFLSSFSVFDIIVIAMCAGLGIAVKSVVTPLVHIITGPLFIPGGAVAGGIYFLFIVLAVSLVARHGAAILVCIVQAIVVIIFGIFGNQGIMSLFTYSLPGIVVDLFYLLVRRQGINAFTCFFMGLLANLTGTFMSNLVFFRLPFVPLMLTLLAGALSGGLGGLIAWSITKQLRKLIPVFNKPLQEVKSDEK
jgi:hypothetical protein